MGSYSGGQQTANGWTDVMYQWHLAIDRQSYVCSSQNDEEIDQLPLNYCTMY
jgi:hypothetical protein